MERNQKNKGLFIGGKHYTQSLNTKGEHYSTPESDTKFIEMIKKNKNQMEPKEKAIELFNKMSKFSFSPEYGDASDLGLERGTFTRQGQWEDYCSKQSALICVDEIIKSCEFNNVESHNTDWWNKVKEYLHSL